MKKQNIEALQKLIRKEKRDLNTEAPEQNTVQKLQVVHVNKLLYKGERNNYIIPGNLSQDLSTLEITLIVEDSTSDRRERFKLDLYNREEVEQCIKTLSARLTEEEAILETELLMLTDLLEKYRDAQLEEQHAYYKKKDNHPIMVPNQEKEALEFLSSPDLMLRTYKLIEKAWITGYFDISRMVFIAMASYKSSTPIHIALIGGKLTVKHFIEQLSQCLPPEDIVKLNDVSARSLYHCTNSELVNKALLLPNGLDKKAGQALDKLQQGDILSTATTIKDRLGNMISSMKQVNTHFSSISYSESGYDRNQIFCVNLDETQETVQYAINYENAIFSGNIDTKAEEKSKTMLCNVIRCLKSIEVINPFAGKIKLPVRANDLPKMTYLFNVLTKQICLFHQFQRDKDAEGRLIAEIDDIWIAGQMLIYNIVMEGDDLDPTLKQLYEGIRHYVDTMAGAEGNKLEFNQREIRQALNLSKNYCFRYMDELYKLEYLERTGHANRGYKYRIPYWDISIVDKKRKEMVADLQKQLEELAGGLTKKAS